ncbi:MAG TPA: ComF family protein [Amycolatopsis sp.]|uniref:ComF family protein n=1 Tax=Amycolatopsis sp. TaxID=37632 RepID=UPI002B4A000B|nr:ComF family protein [Amycolatopsis sp.]HKS44763.1 ComF family protein [Amycolatopsis sp.]
MSLLDLVLPVSCAGCGTAGSACCPECFAGLTRPAPVARGPTAGTTPVYALARYGGAARRLVLAYKERGRRDLAASLGAALAGALPYLPEARPDPAGLWWLVPVPSRRAASRVRGGPHLLRLARVCAAELAAAGHAAAVAPALRLGSGVRDAVGLDRAQRAANLAGRLAVDARGLPPPGTPVVLLDDVVTTGATAAACSGALATRNCQVTAVLALTAAG